MVVMLLTTSTGLHVTAQKKRLRDQIDHSLVDSHLEVLPRVGTLAAGGLAGGDAEVLGGHTHRSGHLHLLVESNTLNIGADYAIRDHRNSITYPSRGALPEWT